MFLKPAYEGIVTAMKTRTINGAFCRYLKQFGTFMSKLVSAHPSPPWPSIFIAFLGTLLF